MTRPIFGLLIRKDLFLYRWLIVGTCVVALASTFLAGAGGGLGNTGNILLVTSLVVLGVFLAIHSVMTERQSRSLLFALSLPISPMQHAAAKVAGGLTAFLIPWTLVTLVIVLFGGGSGVGVPSLPVTLALMGFLLANFCLLTAIGIVARSEIGSVAGIITTNTLVPVFMTTVMPWLATPQVNGASPWNSRVLGVFGAEFALAVIALGLALHVQSRRTDFV